MKLFVQRRDKDGGFIPDTLDLVPIGAYYGKGKRKGLFGSYLMASYNSTTSQFEPVGKVGIGFPDALLKGLTRHLKSTSVSCIPQLRASKHSPDRWLNPSQVWEIKAAQITPSPTYNCASTELRIYDKWRDRGLALRFPRFLRIREDKKPHQATTSNEILQWFLRSKGR